MELTAEQKQAVAEWVAQGATLSEIQSKLSQEFGMSMTYMDVRFLMLDLGLEVHDKPEPKSAVQADVSQAGSDDFGAPGIPGEVSVEVDRVTKPGSIVSGTVTFSDGVNSAWALDQFGRLALEGADPGYRPSQEDLQEFQLQLRESLEKRGF